MNQKHPWETCHEQNVWPILKREAANGNVDAKEEILRRTAWRFEGCRVVTDEEPMEPAPANWEADLAADMERRYQRGRTARLALLAIALAGVVLALLLKRWGWAG